MSSGKIFPVLFIIRIGGIMRFSAGMKATRLFALYFFGLSLFLTAGASPLWGAEDHLAKLGVYRLDEKIDAPDFTLPDLKGTKRSLSDFKGSFIMLNFWATW